MCLVLVDSGCRGREAGTCAVGEINLAAGEELTIDYRHLLAPGQEETFRDARTGHPIVGLNWRESLRLTSQTLAKLLA